MGSTALTQTAPAPAPIRLDATSHSGRIKYANARDLPGFPSVGVKNHGTAASTAATLGWMNTKPPQHQKSDISATASAAALLASDHKMASTEGTRRNAAEPQAAASLAADSVQRHRHDQSPPPSTWVSSAANLAFKSSISAPPPPDASSLARQGSLRAAKGAMEARRPRAKSSPMPKKTYPNQANAASNALSAATIAHRPSVRAPTVPVDEGGAVSWTTMDRRMYTSHPPVQPEVDEQKRNDVLHASAVAMARCMYNQQQSVIKTTQATTLARSSSFTRSGGRSTEDEIEKVPTFSNLQEAAYRLAQERLAKLQEEHQQNRELQEYYGSSGSLQRSKFGSLRSRLTRRRSASDGALAEDKQRSLHIRKQMSLFDTKLAEVDEKKQEQDRQALLAVAQRNVQARLRDMDEKIQEETGWVKPSTREDWEWRARASVQARFEASRLEEQRKVDIGGGKLMDRDAVEAIAARRVQPLLNEINEKAERERELTAQRREDEEKQREEAERNKAREKEIQEIHKQLKEQQKDQDRLRKSEIKHEEKARKADVKQEEKARKEDAKTVKAEQKRHSRLEKQKEKEAIPPTQTVDPPTSEPLQKKRSIEVNRHSASPTRRALAVTFPKRHSKQNSKDLSDKPPVSDRSDPATSPSNKVRSWLKIHFGRPRSLSSSGVETGGLGGSDHTGGGKKKFIGGAALARLTGRNGSSPSVGGRRSVSAGTSVREMAIAGRPGDEDGVKGDEVGEESNMVALPVAGPISDPGPSRSGRGAEGSTSLDNRSVSSLSSLDTFEEARTTLSERPVTPPRFIRVGPERGQASPVRGSRFSEILE